MSSLKISFSNRLKYLVLRFIYRVKTPKDLIKFINRKHKTTRLLVKDDVYRTFAETNRNINRFCNLTLLLGLVKGDSVVVLLKNCFEFIDIRLACYKAGLVFCALTDEFTEEEVAAQLSSMHCNLFIHDQRITAEAAKTLKRQIPGMLTLSLALTDEGESPFHSMLSQVHTNEHHLKISNNDLSAIGFTSGTTDSRKAVAWSHQAWITSFYHFLLSAPKTRSSNSVYLHTMPLSTVGSLSILPGLASGSLNVLLEEFNVKKAAEAIDHYKVTNLIISPSFMIDLWDYFLANRNQLDFTSLRLISIGSAALSRSKLKRMIATFGPIFQQGYGMAEVLAPLSGYKYENTTSKQSNYATVGKPLSSINIKLQPIADSKFSRICVQSKTCCEGYWHQGEIVNPGREKGWFTTTDLGYFDAQGQLYLQDRESNILRKNGKEIAARELEEIIHECPGVKDVSIHMLDKKLKGWISPLSGCQLAEDQVKLFCKTRCPVDWIPNSIDIVSELPYSSSGKLLKYKLGANTACHSSLQG